MMPEGGRGGPGVTFWVPRVWVSPLWEGNGIIEKPLCKNHCVYLRKWHREVPGGGLGAVKLATREEKWRRGSRGKEEDARRVFWVISGGSWGCPGGPREAQESSKKNKGGSGGVWVGLFWPEWPTGG